MRAEMVAARLTAQGPALDAVGRSSKARDELAAYLAGVPNKAMLYARVAYFGEHTERNIYRLYLNVLLEVSRDWQPIGTMPKTKEAILRYQKRQAALVERLTRMAVREILNPAVGLPSKPEWRAAQLGISRRAWDKTYRDRYDRVWQVLNSWDSEFRHTVTRNQRPEWWHVPEGC